MIDVLEWAFENPELLPFIFIPIGFIVIIVAYFYSGRK